MKNLILTFLAATALILVGCQGQQQVGQPNVYQFQFNPAGSDNARPANAEKAPADGVEDAINERLGRTLTWRNNRIKVEITTTGESGRQDAEADQENTGEGEFDITP